MRKSERWLLGVLFVLATTFLSLGLYEWNSQKHIRSLGAVVAKSTMLVEKVCVFTHGGTLSFHGSAFRVGEYAITNKHVTTCPNGEHNPLLASYLFLHVPDDRGYATELLYPSKNIDLSLLSADNLPSTIVSLCLSDDTPESDGYIVATGYPIEEWYRWSKEDAVRVSVGTFNGPTKDGVRVAHTGYTNFGSSGGPVIDESGCVFGINTRLSADFGSDGGEALPAKHVRQMILEYESSVKK